MTRIDLSTLAREFADAPVDAVATVRVQGWAGSAPASTVNGAGVVFSPRNEVIVRGDAPERTVELPATDGTFCYRWDVSARSGTLRLATRYTLVPESVEPVLFGDLVDVDPASFEPTPNVVAAWTAAIAEVAELRELTANVASEAGGSADSASSAAAAASGSATVASTAAGQAATSAGSASTAAGQASTAAGQAFTAATAAGAARDGAITARSAAETAAGSATNAAAAAAQSADGAAGAAAAALTSETDRDGSPFRIALTRSGRKPVGRGEQVLNFNDYAPTSSDGQSGNVTANNSAMNFLADDLALLKTTFWGQDRAPVVWIPRGYYRIGPAAMARLTTAGAVIQGSGPGQSYLGRAKDTASDFLTIGYDYGQVRDLTLDGSRLSDSPGFVAGDMLVVNAKHTKQFNVHIINAPRDALAIGRDAQAINAHASSIVVRDCRRYGVNVAAGTNSTDVELDGINVGRSGLSAIRLAAASTTLNLCHVWGAGWDAPGGSTDIHGYLVLATGMRLVNCEGETCRGDGVSFRSGAHNGEVTGGRFWGNGNHGVYSTGATNGRITTTVAQNGVLNTGNSTGAAFSGVELNNSTDWVVNGLQAWDFFAEVPATSYPGYVPAFAFPGRPNNVFRQSRPFVESGTSDFNNVQGSNIRQSKNLAAAVFVGANTISLGNQL